MKFKHFSRRKAMIALLFMFVASAIAGILLSAPAVSAKALPTASKSGFPVNINGHETAISAVGLPLAPVFVPPKILQTNNYNYGITTHEITTPTTYLYITPGGNYSFSKSLPWAMSYTSLWENNTSFSGYGIKEQNQFLVPSTSTITIGNTTFESNTIEGTISNGSLDCIYDFSSVPETTSCTYTRASSDTNNYNIVWVTTGIYISTNMNSAYQASSQSGNSTIGSYDSVSIGANSSPSNWHNFLTVNWNDFGNTTVIYGKLGFLSAEYGYHYGIMVEFPQNISTVDPSLVQNTTGGSSCAFVHPVVAGNMLIVTTANSVASATDTIGTTFSNFTVSTSTGIISPIGATIYYGVAPTSASDTINKGGACYEVSGVTAGSAQTGTGSLSTTPSAVNTGTLTPTANSFIVVEISDASCTGATATNFPTTGYTAGTFPFGQSVTGTPCDNGNAPGPTTWWTDNGYEYYTTWPGGSTTAALDLQEAHNQVTSGGIAPWVEIAAYFPPSRVTEQVTITPANSYSSSDSASIAGCSPSASTIAMDGVQHSFTVISSCSLTYTVTLSGTAGYSFASNATTWVYTTASSGTDTKTNTVYRMYYNTIKVAANGQANFDTGMTWSFTCAQSDTSSSTCSISSTAATSDSYKFWTNYNQAITAPAASSSPPSNTRWENAAGSTSTAGTPTTGGNTYTTQYWKQDSSNYDYVVNDGGVGYSAPSLSYNQLGVSGSGSPLTLTTSPSSTFYVDVGSISYTNPLTGSSSSERWEAPLTTSIVLGGTTTISYYHQYLQTYSYTITGGAGASSPPTFTFTYLGSGGTTNTASTTPATQFVDATTSWTFTNPLTGSSSSERWQATSGTSGTVSSAVTISPNYYHQYSYTVSYSVSGGGSPTVPQYSCTQFGAPLVYSLTSSPTVEWSDSGCSYSFTNPVQLVNMPTSATPKERWFTGVTSSGTVGSAQVVAATYYNQYWFNNTALTLTYVYTGVTEPASVYQGWVDSGSALTVTGVYSHVWTVKSQASLYQSSNGIQFYANRSASSFTFSTAPVQTTFSGTHMNMTQFIDTGILLVVHSVTDNGNSISFTTVSVSDGKIYKFVGSSNFVVVYSSNGITTISNSNPIYEPYQTKTFPALSYLWAFYCDGTNLNFTTSVDGLSWAASTTIAACTSGQVFSVAISGTTMIYTRTDGTAVYYRLGTISISGGAGIITWAAAEQTAVASGAGNTYSNVYAAIDTNGYSWISYNKLNGGTDYALVTETQSVNGVWSTAAGFPYQATSSGSPYAQEVIPLTAGKVALLWSQTGQKLSIQVWAGGTWTSTYQNTNVVVSLYYFSAQSSFDTINIAYLWNNGGTYTVQLARFFYSPIGFVAESTVSTTSTTSTSAPVIYKNSVTGNYEIVYVGSSNTFYGNSFSAAGALGTVHSIYADTSTVTNNDELDITPLSDSTTRIGIMFVEGTGPSWKLQYLVLYSASSFQLILNPSVGSRSVNSTNYFTITYTVNGGTQTLQYTGTPINVAINADAGSPVIISGSTSLSNTNKEVWWFQTGGASITFTAGNSTVSYTYYDLLAQVARYAIVGGGSPTAPTLTYTTVPSSAGSIDNPVSVVYTLTTSPVTIYATRTSTANATPQLNGITNEIWTPKVAAWKIASYNQISNPINYYHKYQIGVSYRVLFGGSFTPPVFNYVADGTSTGLNLTNSNQNIYIDVSSAWTVTSPLIGSTSTERAATNPSAGTITSITTYVFTYTHQFGVQFKFSILPSNGVIPSYSGAPTLTIIQGQARTVINLTTTFVTTWVDAGTEWAALNPWISGANTFNPTNAGGIVAAQGTISNTNPITIFYQLAPRCVGNNTTLLAEQGCFFPAVFYVFANLLGPFFAGLLIAALCMAIYIKTENGILSVFLFFISAIILGFLFPPIFGQAILIGLAAMVTFAIYEAIRSNQ